MNEQTAKVLEQMAQKLGTTSEYLWGILIKQAPIEATLILIQLIFVSIFGVFLWKTHIKLSKKIEGSSDYNNTLYAQKEELVTIPMVVFSMLFLAFFLVSLINISSMVYGYFNPEYWALKEVMHTIGGK